MKKPAYAMASVTPASAAATPIAAPAEGDISEPALPLRASLTSSDPLPKPSARKVQYDGAYHVQVGAYMSQDEAENRLGMVQQRAMALLDGHLPFTASFMKGDKEWYRARFAGFSKADAQAACAALKKMSLDCVVMSAE
jgi:D-alanyl-D-alanine carboxypeptidase